MKRLFAYLVIAMTSVGCYADDYGFLTFEQQSGTKKSIPALGTRITFADGQALATYGEETYEVGIADLAKMYFSPEDITTGIRTVNGSDNVNGNNTAVYDLQGRMISSPSGGGWEGASSFISLPSSKKGIYIVRKNGQTFKTIIK